MSKKIKSLTKKQIKEAVMETTGDKDINSKDNQVGYILLASLEKGPNDTEIAKFLSLDEDFVKTVGKRLRKYGVWTKDNKIECDWSDEESGGIAFIMDILVGQGLVERKTEEEKINL